jgi:hypothetical protein
MCNLNSSLRGVHVTPLREFEGPQQGAVSVVPGRRQLRWLELDCPRCRQRTYIGERERRLARVGSQREYAPCAHCGLKLTLGRLVVYPNGSGLLKRLAFWRKIRRGETLEARS